MASNTKRLNTTDTKINLFTFMNSISENKEYIFSEDTSKEYSAYMINRGLSNHPDCLFLANEMNKYSSIPTQSQYDFYYHAVSKKKRYGGWNKAEKNDSITLVMDAYGYSRSKAEQVVDILTIEQLSTLEKRYGGRAK